MMSRVPARKRSGLWWLRIRRGALKFGDADEYGMIMEDLRRGADQAQQEGVERARARTTRTPGTPAASGKVPEGSSRGERRGPPRERPKKK